ncbi:MAG: outer membrane lipoprotein carrier protein LolA [Chitinophagales bacterium]
MIKYIFIFLISLLCFEMLYAQTDFTRVKDQKQIQAEIEKSSKSIKSIKSLFTQYKYLDVLEDEIESKGKFLFKAPDYLKWEYQTPYEYIILRKGDKMLINDEGQLKEYDISSNQAFSAINNMMINLVTGNFFESGDYKATFFENGEMYKVVLVPVESQMADFLENIELFFDRQELQLQHIQMNEMSGDYTKIVFSEKTLNATIPDAAFSAD